ncbi:MAG: histone deacetylase [bacterium]
MRDKAGIIYSDRYLDHDTGGHVENADRLRAIRAALMDAPWSGELVWLEPREADIGQVARIHDTEYIEYVRRACAETRGRRYLNPDTVVSPESYGVALLAAGGVLTAIDAAADGAIGAFFALVRPPGHHAEAAEPLGFCLFNNVAVGARYAQRERGIERVFIFDWDVHHGNGTMHSFESDPTVYFTSFHQYPHYPGTGRAGDVGTGEGEGYTLNLPMPAGSDDADYLFLTETIVSGVVRRFDPGLLLISAGFDAHAEDPLSGTLLTEDGYAGMMHALAAAAGADCPIGLVLEGGYNLHTLSSSAAAAVAALLGRREPPVAAKPPSPYALKLADELRKHHPYLRV